MRPFAYFALGLPALFCLSALPGLGPPLAAQSAGSARARFAGSIQGVAGMAHIVRHTLTADELAAPLDFVVSLAMPRFDELETRIQQGQSVSRAALEANYLPAEAEYERVMAWLRSQGFTITLRDSSHTNIFARGSVASISRSFEVPFARVATVDGEFTSAISAPSLPSQIAGSVLSINGLQPHARAHHGQRGPVPAGGTGAPGGAPTPADIAYAYNFPSSPNGAGQIIAIISDATPAASDLVQFWTACGVPQSLANYTAVSVNGGPSPGGDAGEATLDVEWATGMAPGAAVRLYVVPDISYASLLQAVTEIMNDLPQYPGLHQVSISFGGPEPGAGGAATLLSYSQVYAQLATMGVTIFASSGDGGSNPGIAAGVVAYGASNPLAVEYPASDPDITAVGGTALGFSANGIPVAENVWFSNAESAAGFTVGSGGGYSINFSRPAWQTGFGVPVGGTRCLPDVAAQANAGYFVIGGQPGTCWGTSMAAPIWAAACAVINQARAQAGLSSVGLLGPLIYPLLGTNSLRDITTGGNGAYSAGSGYDLCTGMGTPNVTNLIAALTVSFPPSITLQPFSQTVASGRSAVFNATAAGVPAPAYQWTFNGAPIPGATDPVLEVSNATSANAGIYACIVSNSGGTVTSGAAALTIGPAAIPSRLFNISTRAWVGTGTNILVAGFEIGGTAAETVLIRAIGPGLTTTFQLANTLSQPVLTVYSGSTPLYSNTVWGNDATIAQVAGAVGAFPLQPASQDSALLVTLPPGGYTAQVTGVADSAGLALVEVYEVY